MELTAKKAREISEGVVDNTFVKNNIDYILEKVKREAHKGEFHVYISNSELVGNINVENVTMTKIETLGYNVCVHNCIYKISW